MPRGGARAGSLLEAVALALAENARFETALEQSLRAIVPALGFDTGWVWLIDSATSRPYLAASFELPPYLREPLHMTGETCWCLESLGAGDFARRSSMTIECSRLRGALRAGVPEQATGHRTHVSVLLRFGSRPLGIMNLSAAQEPAPDDERDTLLGALGAQIGLAVERAMLYEASAVAARNDERTRVAREIHDTLAQDLAAITLQLESARRRLERDPLDARARVDAALDLAREALDRARSTLVNLRADPLGGRPLGAALAALARACTAESGVIVTFADETTHAVAYAVEIELYRIASEAVRNLVQHARAQRAQIALSDDATALTLTISDDGGGGAEASLADHQRNERFGVIGMCERATGIDATFTLHSPPGGGTHVAVRVPAARARALA